MKCKLSGLLLLAALLMPAAAWAAPAPGYAVVYDNTGPTTGQGESFLIVSNDMFGPNAVTDPFGCCGVADQVQFLAWTDGSTVNSVDWAITTAPFGGTTIEYGTATSLGNVLESEGDMGASYLETFSLNTPVSAGWLQLSNANASDGGFVGWDESDSGTIAFWSSSDGIFPIPSETFQMLGTPEDCVTPEPSSFLLLGSGLAGLAGLIKRKLSA
jgi:hypothetical protein